MAINLCPLCNYFNGFEEKSGLKNHVRNAHLCMLCMSNNFVEHLTEYCVSEKSFKFCLSSYFHSISH